MSFFRKQKLKNRIYLGQKLGLLWCTAFIAIVLSNISLAATISGDPPRPGTPISNYPTWQQAIQNYNGPYASDLNRMVQNGLVPTSPSAYGSFLKGYGGYTWQETDQAGIRYVNDLVADPATNTFWARTFGYSDDYLLSRWSQGQTTPQPTAPQKGAAMFGYGTTKTGNAVANTALKAILGPVIAVLFAITYALTIFVSWAGELLDLLLNPNLYNFTGNQMIQTGWIMVRDVCNLFFLLVLLFIAICTILKIEKYHAKKTLLVLIIMALLINFSRPIAVFVFDGSQLLMNEFLKQMNPSGAPGQSPSVMYTSATGVAKMIYDSVPEYWSTSSNSTAANIFVSYLFAIVFLFMYMVALLILGIQFIIRIVAIMLLIIVSPFAFFANIIPDFSKLSSKWWSALFEYSYYGPAAAFFLLLATKLTAALPKLTDSIGSGGNSFQRLSVNILHYMTTLVFLYASILMAKQFGGGIGSTIVGYGNKFMKRAAKMGGTGLLAAGTFGQYWRARDAAKGTMRGISQKPGFSWITKEGREKQSKERQEKWAGKFAPFNIADVKKKAKDMENDSKAKVETGVKRGDAAAIFESARRGDLTANDLKDPRIRNLMKTQPDFENAIYKNLRDSGNAQVQYEDMVARGKTPTSAFNDTYGKLSFNQMADKGDLKKALSTEGALGGRELLDKINTLNDPQTIRNLQARTTNKETYDLLRRLQEYKAWERGGAFTGPVPTGWTGPAPNTLTPAAAHTALRNFLKN